MVAGTPFQYHRENVITMKHIVYCWELGEGLGHMVALAKIVEEMTKQGNKVTCVLKDLTHAPALLGPIGAEWMAAPRIWSGIAIAKPLNHADILHNVGYSNGDNIHALLVAWRTLFAALRPDKVVCEYAPTAALAARTLDFDVVSIDSGFSMPPLPASIIEPLPAIRFGVDSNKLADCETRTLASINMALSAIGMAPLPAFSYMFRGKVWYRNWCEFNHFAPHLPERHLGQVLGESNGERPVWPPGKGKKVFAYLKPQHPQSAAVLKAAVAAGYRVVGYLPNFKNFLIDELLLTGRLVVSDKPFDLNELPDDVDIGIWHSPTGAIARCLDKGMRMIALPMHPEQVLASDAVRRAGVFVHVSDGTENWPQVFEKVLSWPSPKLASSWRPADSAEFALKLVEA
jgi:hypothetical protein